MKTAPCPLTGSMSEKTLGKELFSKVTSSFIFIFLGGLRYDFETWTLEKKKKESKTLSK